MSQDAHRRATELFGRALDLAVDEQRSFLERECSGDGALVERVLGLLARDREADATLDHPALERLAPRPALLPERVGPYRILGLLGEGGMGLVYRAEQESPRREVALKVIRSATPSLELVRRFEKEAHVLGRLDHQGIAHVFDAGVFEGPRGPEPFVTMELVPGEPLLAWVEHRMLSREQRIELLARTCDAVAHAHDHGVVHRDLKPSNVLVKDDGQPKVLDFGVALVVRGEQDGSTRQTSAGELIGTLPYMSPEQLSGTPEGIDARSDVYALGVMAFELLTGARPHDLEGLALPAAARLVSEREAPRLGTLDRTLRGDLETIVAKALAKDHAQRYASARELADDLRRYLRHEPVRAVPPSHLYHLRRFARRNPALTTSLALAALLLVAGTVVSTCLARRAEGLRVLAEGETDRARRAAEKSVLAAARIAADHGDFAACRRLLETIEPGARGWAWRWLDRRSDDRIASFSAAEPLLGAAFALDSRELVAVDVAGTLTRWTLGETEPRARLALGTRLTGPAAFDREGRFVAGAHGAKPETVSLWDARSARLLARVSREGVRLDAVAVAPGGARVAFGGKGSFRRSSFLWDPSAAEPAALSPSHLTGAAFSGDGLLLGCCYNSPRDGPGWFVAIDALTGERSGPSRRLASNEALGVALAENGRAAVALRNKHAYVFDPRGTEPPVALSGSSGPVLSVAFDPAGERVASGSSYGDLRLWDARDGRELAVLGGSTAVQQVAFSGDGSRILGLSAGELSVWEPSSQPDVLRGHSSYVYDLCFVRAGARLVSLSYDGELCVWDSASLDLLRRLRLSWPATSKREGAYALASARDGALLALGQPKGAALLQGDSLRILRIFELDEPVRAVSLASDGELLAGLTESRIVLWDVESGVVRRERPLEAGSEYPDLTFSHDGRLVACADASGAVLVLDTSSGLELARLEGHAGAVEALAFSADGELLASGSTDRSVRLWDTGTWRARAVLESHRDRVYALAFSPDGELLASGSNDSTVRLWNVSTGEELALLTGHEDYVFALEFDPDGTRLASASGDLTVRLWDTRPHGERWRVGEQARARRAAARPLVRELLSATGDVGDALRKLREDAALGEDEREARVQALLELDGEER